MVSVALVFIVCCLSLCFLIGCYTCCKRKRKRARRESEVNIQVVQDKTESASTAANGGSRSGGGTVKNSVKLKEGRQSNSEAPDTPPATNNAASVGTPNTKRINSVEYAGTPQNRRLNSVESQNTQGRRTPGKDVPLSHRGSIRRNVTDAV